MDRGYPHEVRERDRWIVEKRPGRNAVNASRPYAFFVESEPAKTGDLIPIATIFLTNRECPWRCLMCDLWRNTLTESVGPGFIPSQITYALSQLPPARQIKLYNSGSFFDSGAIPVSDYSAIGELTSTFECVVVESHPALVGDRCIQFKGLLQGDLEVAMGLETVHPEVLPRLNKRMTLGDFKRAAFFLQEHSIALRVFILVKPPFILSEEEAIEWAARSVDFAFDCGANVVSLIPARPGNGALDALAKRGQFVPPRLKTLEACLAYGINLQRGRVFADVWDLEKFKNCDHCFPMRKARLEQMNLRQIVLPDIPCPHCCT